MTFRGIAKGRNIELDEQLPFPDGEQLFVSIEPPAQTINGSVADVLRAVRDTPHLDPSDVTELEQAIHAGRIPVNSTGAFDNGKS